jgi:hypothetical protein
MQQGITLKAYDIAITLLQKCGQINKTALLHPQNLKQELS